MATGKRIRSESTDFQRRNKKPKQLQVELERSYRPIFCIIPDILDMIDDRDQASLKSLSLASYELSAMANKRLYRKPYFSSIESIERFVATLEKDVTKNLRGLVRVLDIYPVHSPELLKVLDPKLQRQFQTLLNLPSLKRINIGRGFVSHSLLCLANLPKNNSIEELHMEGSVQLFDKGQSAFEYETHAPAIPWVNYAGSSLSQLRKLVLKDLRVVFQDNERKFDNVLEELEVVRCNFTRHPSSLMSGPLRHLRRLRIAVNNEDSEKILHVCRESTCMEELYIISCFAKFEWIFTGPVPTLRKLECRLSNGILQIISRIFPNIEYLVGVNTTGDVREFSASLLNGKFPFLKHLKLLGKSSLSDICQKEFN